MAIQDNPPTQPPADTALRSKLASVYVHRAEALDQQGRHDEALIDYGKAVAAFQTLVDDQGRHDLRGDWANCHSGRAETYRTLGRIDDAMNDLDAAIRMREKIVIVDAGGASRELLAADLNARGELRQQAGELDAAVRDFETAIEIGEALLREGHDAPPARTALNEHRLGAAHTPRRVTTRDDNVGAMPTSRAAARRAQRAADQAEAAQLATASTASPTAQPKEPSANPYANEPVTTEESGDLSSYFPIDDPPPYVEPAERRPMPVTVQPIQPVASPQQLVSYVDADKPRAGKFVVVTRDAGLGVVSKLWVTTENLAAEIATMRAAGARITKVMPVWAYYTKRIAAVAAVISLLAVGFYVLRDGSSGRSADRIDTNTAGVGTRNDAADNSGDRPLEDTKTRAEMAQEIGRKHLSRDEVDPVTADALRRAGVKGDPNGDRVENSGSNVDIFDLSNPDYVPDQFKLNGKSPKRD